MPSIFTVLARIVQGKPIFDANDSNQSSHAASHGANAHGTSIEKYKDSTFPVVMVEDTDSHEHGDRLKIHCSIKNESHGEIFVDKIRMLGKTQELDFTLRPEQERHALVYDGPALKRQAGSEAQLEYKTMPEGDYFQAVHEIRYLYNNAEKTYEVTELRLRKPIRDIFG